MVGSIHPTVDVLKGGGKGLNKMSDRSLANKVALITGAAGEWSGACAHAHARAGADLVLVDLDADRLVETVPDGLRMLGEGAGTA
jgi:NAD(P)-dependent dehydrogenase (short-subunit alcohol dehydrogenase family)